MNVPFSVLHIRFVGGASPVGKVRREFKQPRSCAAVEEFVQPSDLTIQKQWPEPTDHLDVVFVPEVSAGEWKERTDAWMAPPGQPDAPQAVIVKRNGVEIHWRPGRALVVGGADHREEVIAALIDFAFFEGELRSLERTLESGEAEAQADVAHAYQIRFGQRRHWQRFAEKIKNLSQMH